MFVGNQIVLVGVCCDNLAENTEQQCWEQEKHFNTLSTTDEWLTPASQLQLLYDHDQNKSVTEKCKNLPPPLIPFNMSQLIIQHKPQLHSFLPWITTFKLLDSLSFVWFPQLMLCEIPFWAQSATFQWKCKRFWEKLAFKRSVVHENRVSYHLWRCKIILWRNLISFADKHIVR